MSKLGLIGASCLAIALTAATPAMAQRHGGGHFGGGGFHRGGGFHGGGFHRGGGFRGGGFFPGFVAGGLIGGALASGYYGGYGYGYGAPYYYGGYGYDEDVGYEAGYSGSGSVAYCAQRFRSYDPRSGTYLGYDGFRHPCP